MSVVRFMLRWWVVQAAHGLCGVVVPCLCEVVARRFHLVALQCCVLRGCGVCVGWGVFVCGVFCGSSSSDVSTRL